MGKNTKRVEDFIDDIPDSKLIGFSTTETTIYKDRNFRLDMQGMTTGKPKKHNLQVQVNKGTSVTTLKKVAPDTVANLLVLQDDPPSPGTIKKELKATINI